MYRNMSQPRVTSAHKHFRTLDDDVMRKRLLRLLRSVGWSIKSAAEQMGMSRQGLYRIIGNDAELRDVVEAERGDRHFLT